MHVFLNGFVTGIIRGIGEIKRIRQFTFNNNLFYRNWKLITAKGPGGFTHWDGKPSEEAAGQLYNLAKDPSEKNNLWNEMPDKVKAMRSLLAKEKANKKNDKTLK